MIGNLDLITMIMKHMISSNIDSRDITTKNLYRITQKKTQLYQDITNPDSLIDGVGNGTILRFKEDLETVGCFLERQEA